MNFFLVVLNAPFQGAEKLCKVMTFFLHYKIFGKKFSKNNQLGYSVIWLFILFSAYRHYSLHFREIPTILHSTFLYLCAAFGYAGC